MTFDIKFGTVNPPVTVVSAGQVDAFYSPAGPLAANTAFYWQVTSNNPDGPSTGPIWSFVTANVSPPAPGPSLYADGLQLKVNGTGAVYFGLGVTAFPLLKVWLDSGASGVDTFLNWMVSHSIEIARALGMYSGGVGLFDPQPYGAAYFTGIQALADYMATKGATGLRLKLSVFADHENAPLTTINQNSFFAQVAAVCDGRWNIILDGGNEYPQNGWDPETLPRPGSVTASRGSSTSDSSPPVNPWDCFDFHTARNDNWPKATKSVFDIQTGNGTPLIAVPGGTDEMIGIDETNDPGRSTANADDVFDFVANPFGSYIVLHTRSSITALGLPGPNAQACVNAAVAAAGFLPANFREGTYTRSGLPDLPITDSPLDGNGEPTWWLRAYARIQGTTAWCVIIRPNFGAGLVISAAGPWTIVAQYGARGNIIHLTR